MKWKLNPMVESVRNKVGNLVFWPLPSGRVISRSRVIPHNPRSAAQNTIRGYMAAASAVWATCTAAQVTAWDVLAQMYTRTDSDGNTVPMQGRTLCTMVNFYRLLFEQAVAAAPPSGTPPQLVASVTTMEVTAGATSLECTFATTNNTEALFLVKVAPPLPGGRKVFRHSDFIIPTADLVTSFQDITPVSLSGLWSVGISALNAKASAAWGAAVNGEITAAAVTVVDKTTYLPQIEPFGVWNSVTLLVS